MNSATEISNIKMISNLIKSSTIDLPREHYFYVHLIDFLSPLYPKIEISKLQSLSNSTYKYFRFLLSFDEFIDSRNDVSEIQMAKFINLKDGFTNYEQSICGLAYLFSPESAFWCTFQQCKDTYFKTILSEKQMSYNKSSISEIFFEQIAKGKSAICLNAVYAIQILAESYDFEQKLIELVNQIHIAFQLLDDIDDFKKDIHERQWTYPQYQLQEYLAANNIKDIDNALKQKYLYISGIAESNLKKAIIHFQNARNIAIELQLLELANFTKKQICNTELHKKEILFLHQKAKIKAQKSQIYVKNNDLERSIANGISYLKLNLELDFSWSDFMTSAGSGKAWITGFVGMNLAEVDNNLPYLIGDLGKVNLLIMSKLAIYFSILSFLKNF